MLHQRKERHELVLIEYAVSKTAWSSSPRLTLNAESARKYFATLQWFLPAMISAAVMQTTNWTKVW